MKRLNIILIIILALIALIVAIVFFMPKNTEPNPAATSDAGKSVTIPESSSEEQTLPGKPVIQDQLDSLKVVSPESDEFVTSPLVVTGQASAWYFEAVFPVRVTDEKGNVLGSGQAIAQGDWMTTDFVPFSGTIIFDAKDAARGFVVFEKDNPSGLPENALSFSLPVRFTKD